MNLLHMKYAVVIARTHSINKAAEELYVGQSALSRAMKELEAKLGVTLFERSAKGMVPTPDGEVFVHYAKSVLKQVENLENLFHQEGIAKRRFSVSVSRASYIADAFAAFSRSLQPGEETELIYKETNSMRTLKNLLQEDYKLGILRYAESYQEYYRSLLEEKGLVGETVTRFRYVLLFSENSVLAQKEKIRSEDLLNLVEIAHADPYVPSLPSAEVKKEALFEETKRRIYVFERASQFELLSRNPETFMWVSPVPQELLDRYGLRQKKAGQTRVYKDVLIHRRDYKLSELDNRFISELIASKRRIIDPFRE